MLNFKWGLHFIQNYIEFSLLDERRLWRKQKTRRTRTKLNLELLRTGIIDISFCFRPLIFYLCLVFFIKILEESKEWPYFSLQNKPTPNEYETKTSHTTLKNETKAWIVVLIFFLNLILIMYIQMRLIWMKASNHIF